MTSDDLIDDGFLIYDRLWFVGPAARPDDMAGVQKCLSRADTDSGLHPVAFTDADLASEFIERVDGIGRLKPFTCPTIEESAVFLTFLLEHGDTHLAIDPRATKGRVIPIRAIRDALRSRNA